MSTLFSPIKIRSVEIRNRVWLSPLCQYSAVEGMPNDWHLVHLGKFAMGGVGLIMTEATGISPTARSTQRDTGIWSDEQGRAWKRIVDFVHEQGAVIGIQLWHVGQKGSTGTPWEGQEYVPVADGGWEAVSAGTRAFGKLPAPHQLTQPMIDEILVQYQDAARRSLQAGFDVVEIHGAHGYLIHSFLSPITNTRTDQYGGTFENRIRFVRQVVASVRAVWPDSLPLFLRTSAHDWVEGGWTSEENAELARILLTEGVDLVDCSSGGITPDIEYPVSPGYQVPFAQEVKEHSEMLACAVGMITDPYQADEIIRSGQADAVMLGRELLRDPNWTLRAAGELGYDIEWLNQYKQAKRKN